MAEEQGDVVPPSPDIHFEPLVQLPLVDIKTLEEDEDTLFTMRAKLYRYDSSSEPAEWKERGTGDLKILKHKSEDYVRILMRRDKTLKICANHYIQPYMELKPNNSSDRAWVWSVLADFADEEPKPELLAIKFANVENAQKFKEAFNEAKSITAKFLERQKETEGSHSENDDENESASEDESSSAHSTPVKVAASPKKTEEVSGKLSELTIGKSEMTKEEVSKEGESKK